MCEAMMKVPLTTKATSNLSHGSFLTSNTASNLMRGKPSSSWKNTQKQAPTASIVTMGMVLLDANLGLATMEVIVAGRAGGYLGQCEWLAMRINATSTP